MTMAEAEGKEEAKREPKKGKFLACIAIMEVEECDDPFPKQLNRIFKTDIAAERAIYEWLKREHMGRKDEREFLVDSGKEEDETEWDLAYLITWLAENKKLRVTYDIEELDE